MASLEIFDRHGRFVERKEVAGDKVTVGRDDGCTIVVDESTVSSTHALLEPAGVVRWTILDLGSTNGTKVNGDRLFVEQVLADGDNIQLGRVRIVYHNSGEKRGPKTEPLSAPPRLTRREYEALLELVRPILEGSAFTPPADVTEIAKRMFVTKGAVTNHLVAMYQKFGIDDGPHRRTRLAQAAVSSGAVNFGDYVEDDDEDGVTPGGDDFILGRYEVLETISSGPGGSLRKAHDHQLGLTVALKTLMLPESSARNELLAETKILLRVEPHPGLPRLRTDDFLDDSMYVIVMDWVDGTDLGVVLQERGDPGLRKSAVVDYIAQVAAALDHLHSHDPPIVHGDVKPSNLVLTASNKVVLLDFGIARLAGEGIGAGTRGFTAPEVSAGHPCGPAADVYGLAATAYALLTGSAPSSGRPDWEGVDREDVATLMLVFARGLATEPGRRYLSAGEFADRLRAGRGALPTGVVTLVALEIMDADEHWDIDSSLMSRQSDRVAELVGTVVDESGGMLLGAEPGGGRFLAVFTSAASAVRAAWRIVHEGTNAAWARDTNLAMRAGLFTGEPERRDGAYVGSAVARAQRLRSRADRGGMLLSSITTELVRDRLPAGAEVRDTPPSDAGDGSNGDRAFAVVAGGAFPITEARPASPTAKPVPAAPRAARLPSVDDPECARLEQEIRTALGKQDVAARAGQDKLAAKWGADAALLAQALVERRRQIGDSLPHLPDPSA